MYRHGPTRMAASRPSPTPGSASWQRRRFHAVAPLREAEASVLRALAYADVFDFPLDAEEIFRFCDSASVSRPDVRAAAERLAGLGAVHMWGPYYFLSGRQDTVFSRAMRSAHSRQAWRTARRWGHVLWGLPFVRMVAVTGSLAADSKKPEGDIDYLIVAAPGRLWLVRGLCLLVWRLARLFNAHLCPNYFVSTHALAVEKHDLYAAHELVQMVPLHGRSVASLMWESNGWTRSFLPNADLGTSLVSDAMPLPLRGLKRLAEWLLSGPVADGLERWERTRKIPQLAAEVTGTRESSFSPDVCKHHTQAHGQRVLDRFRHTVAELELPYSSTPVPSLVLD